MKFLVIFMLFPLKIDSRATQNPCKRCIIEEWTLWTSCAHCEDEKIRTRFTRNCANCKVPHFQREKCEIICKNGKLRYGKCLCHPGYTGKCCEKGK